MQSPSALAPAWEGLDLLSCSAGSTPSQGSAGKGGDISGSIKEGEKGRGRAGFAFPSPVWGHMASLTNSAPAPPSASATPKFTNLEVHRALLLDHGCLLQLLLGVHLPRLLGLQRNTWSTPSGAEQPPLPQQDQATLWDSVVTPRAHQGCATELGSNSHPCFGLGDGTGREPIQGCANPMDFSCLPSPACFYLCSPGEKKIRGKKEKKMGRK